VIPQLKDRIGAVIHTHYPRERSLGIQMLEQEAGVEGGQAWPVLVPPFMKEIIEQITIAARASKHIDQQSGVSARFSIANYRTMVASARHRAVRLGESPAVPRISDLGHLYASSLGKLELDLMGSHQLSERQVLDAIIAEGMKIEVGDAVPSADYRSIVADVPALWEKAFEVNAAKDPAVRASCIEFILAGLYATERISRIQSHGHTIYDTRGYA
jgi:magnesium chelatase subunit I